MGQQMLLSYLRRKQFEARILATEVARLFAGSPEQQTKNDMAKLAAMGFGIYGADTS